MQIIRRTCLRVHADTRGVTALEYGMIAALIAVVAVSGFSAIGGNLAATLAMISAVI